MKPASAKTAKKNRVTIADLAGELGLSSMTVSRAFTGSSQISEKTKEEILKRARERGYIPDRWARSLVTRRSSIIGVVIPEIAHTYFADVTSGVEEVFDKTGFDILLCHSRGNAKKERAEIQMLIGSRADGLIIASVQESKTAKPFPDLIDTGIPFVLVDRYFPGRPFSSVHVDDLAVGELAARYLADLGHRRIAHIQGPEVSPSALRGQGFLEALAKRGIAVRRGWLAGGDFGYQSGYEAMRRILDSKVCPTAVFAANDPPAIGAVRACRDAGLRVPEDMSIVGAGCVEGEHSPNPFMTTISWPTRDLGRMAARLLLEGIQHPNRFEPQQNILTPSLLVRQSTGPPARGSDMIRS